jgi:hypothetical protein
MTMIHTPRVLISFIADDLTKENSATAGGSERCKHEKLFHKSSRSSQRAAVSWSDWLNFVVSISRGTESLHKSNYAS